ncbi:MAG: hypothetical protein U0271_30240 [Polyangiaceae bacterium]
MTPWKSAFSGGLSSPPALCAPANRFAWKVAAALGAGTLALGFSLFGGCSDDTGTGGEGGGENPELVDVVYLGGTDEALEALLAASIKDEPANAPVFDEPLDGATIGPDNPTFRWHLGSTTARRGPTNPVDPRTFGAPRAPELSPLERTLGALLHSALAHTPAAYAHGTPVNGAATFIVLSTDADDKVLRVFTTSLELTPDNTAWGQIKDAAAASNNTLHAQLTYAIFEDNRVAQDGGPWQGAEITVTVTP